MTKPIRARTMDRTTVHLSLKNFGAERVRSRDIAVEVVPIEFKDDEATKRLVMHSAKRVIKQHKDELQELAYK